MTLTTTMTITIRIRINKAKMNKSDEQTNNEQQTTMNKLTNQQ